MARTRMLILLRTFLILPQVILAATHETDSIIVTIEMKKLKQLTKIVSYNLSHS